MQKSFLICSLILVFFNFDSVAQKTPPLPFGAIPTIRQLDWHELETYAFVHFTTNTFTDKEWGFGDESTMVFNPSEYNAEQWVKTMRDVGLKALILTCKHHDGFCLWPSKYTEHSVKNSPFKNGDADVVKDVSDACRKYGLKFGVYLSPWDRNHAGYGTQEYIDYYRNQLSELFTNYGPIFEMWLDGANGGDGYYGGKREKRKIDGSTYYQWPETIEMVRKMQPDVVFFSDAGPDIRWCGNESGYMNETNWCTINNDTLYAGKGGIEKLLNTGEENGNKWIPAEVDVSIRPGWFYHESENDKVKSPTELFNIYLKSVGRGSNLLLNIPPDRRGLIHENDVKSLLGFKKLLDEAFPQNLAKKSKISASSYRGNSKDFSPKNLIDGNKETYWATNDNIKSASIILDFKKPTEVEYVVIQEYIKLGQRIKSFSIEIFKNNQWETVAKGTTIGYKRIMKIEPAQTQKIRINFTDSKACPVISNIEVY